MSTAPFRPSTVGISGHPAAFSRKTIYVISRFATIGSFEPLKRTLDILFAAIALIVTSPFLCYFASRGVMVRRPVFKRTERVGRFGRRYREYELAGSHRSFFQRLPLLFNIVIGDMSLIGPRAVSPGDPAVTVSGGARLTMKPGLICSWWLRARANIDFDTELNADLEYINTASLTADFGMALRAIPALIFSEKRDSSRPTVEILGIRVDNLSMAETLRWIQRKLTQQDQSAISMTNAHCANISCVDDSYRQALLASGLNLADGIGLRIAAGLKRTPIRQNVNGTDLFPRLCSMLAETDQGLYLMGGQPGVAQQVVEWIGQHYPSVKIAGYRHGYFKPHEEPAVAEEIRLSGASVLLVAMGVPHQELWIQRNLARTGVRVAIGVGGLFDFYSGRIPRAPIWMREVGIEWTYRLLQEPGRMWRRYLIGNWTFLARHLLYECNVYHPCGGEKRS